MTSCNQIMQEQDILTSSSTTTATTTTEELVIKNEYIVNVVQAFSEIAVSFESNYSFGYSLQRHEQKFVNLGFIVPSSVLTETLITINNSKSVIISDNCKIPSKNKIDEVNTKQNHNNKDNSYTEETFLVACKRTFGNWKIEFFGTEKEVTELATCLLHYQVGSLSYVTMDITKSDYNIMMSYKMFWDLKNLITFVPTGYDGYSINLDLEQENIREIVNDLLCLFNHNNNPNCSRKIINKDEETRSRPYNRAPMPLHLLQTSNLKGTHQRPLEFIKPSQNQEKIIQLNKQEVAFLLGRNGDRISSIRNQSGCMIYILPTAKQIENLSKRRTPQSVKLVGTKEKIHNACALIETNLLLFKENNSNFL